MTTRAVDYDPFAPPEDERGIASQMLDVASNTAFSRGVVSGAHDIGTMFTSAAEGLRTAYDPQFSPDLAPPKPLEGYERRVPGVENIDPSLGDPFGTADRALTWLGETLGSSLSQMAPTIGASMAAGVVTGGPGAVATPMMVSTIQNFGDVWQGFKQDKDIQKAIKEGRLSHQTAAQVAAATGIAVGALDAFSVDKILSITGLKKGGAAKTIREAGKRALLAAAAKGAGFEGLTEAMQSVIAQGAEVGLGAPEMIDWADRGLRTLNEFLAGAVGGGAVGAGVAVLKPKEGIEDEETVGEAQPAPPEAGVAPVAPEAGGQPTPGGTGTVAPPPAGAPATATTPAPVATPQPAVAAPAPRTRKKAPVVVPEGQVPPDVAAAASPQSPPTEVAAAIPAPVATPVADVVEEEDGDLLDEEQDETAQLDEIASAKRRMDEIMRRVLEATSTATTPAAVPDQDVAAALGAQQAVPTSAAAPAAPPVAPPAPFQEPGPTEGAAVRRASERTPEPRGGVSTVAAQQQEPLVSRTPVAPVSAPPVAEFTGTTIQGPSAPTAVPDQATPQIAPAAPAAAPAPEILTPPTYTTRPVDYDPFAGRPTEVVRAAPKQETIPLTEKKERQPYLVRQMADRLRQEVQATRASDPQSDVFYEGHPDLEQAIGEVAAERTAELVGKRGVAPRRAVEERVEAALKDLDQRLIARREAEATAEERATMAAIAKSMETARRAKLEGTPQERARAGKLKGKKAEELRAQSQASWRRLAQTEAKKPEAERAPELVEYEKARAERAKLKGRDKDKQTVLTLEIEKQQQAYIERIEREETAAPPAPARETLAVPTREEARQQAEARRSTEITKHISKALASFPKDLPKLDEIFSSRATNKSIAEHRRTTLPRYVEHINKGFKAAGLKLKDNVSFSRNSPEENLAVFANQLLTQRDDYPGQAMSEFFQAVEFLQGYYTDPSHAERLKDLESLKGLISKESIDARELNENTIPTAPEVADGSYDPEKTTELFYEEEGPLAIERIEPTPVPPTEMLTQGDEPSELIRVKDTRGTMVYNMLSYRKATGKEMLKETRSNSNKVYQAAKEAFNYFIDDDYRFYGNKGFYNVIRRVTSRQLEKLVGDVDIHFVDNTDMYNFSRSGGIDGLFLNYSQHDIRKGFKPIILINKQSWDKASEARKEHVIMHELAHAATYYAMHHNIRNIDSVITVMRRHLEEILKGEEGFWAEQLKHYGFENNNEFVAEAFSNEQFQQLLSHVAMQTRTIREIGLLMPVPPNTNTLWDMFVRVVSSVVSKFNPTNRPTFFEQIVKLAPDLAQSTAQQREYVEANFGQIRDVTKQVIAEHDRAVEEMNRRWSEQQQGVRDFKENRKRIIREVMQRRAARKAGLELGSEDAAHPHDLLPIMSDMAGTIDGARRTALDTGGWFSRKALKFATTEEMKRRSHRLFGEGPNPFTRLADAFLGSSPLRRRYQEEGHKVTAHLARYYNKDQAKFQELSDVMHDATLYNLDLSQPLQSPANAHVSKKGNRDAHRRAAYARLKPRWDALPQEAKDAGMKVIDHYREMENLRVEKTVRNILHNATRPADKGGLGVTLPTGETEASVLKWVLDGDIDKPAAADPANVQPGERNARDLAILDALGKTALSLKGTREMRRIKGWYVPLMRWGKYFFTARENIPTPAGATVDATQTNGKHFIFKNEKEMQAYVNSGRDQVLRTNPEYYEPGTDKRTKREDIKAGPQGLIVPEKRFRVIVQDRVMEMHDSQHDLRALQKRYRDSGYHVDDIDLVDTVLHRNSQVLPQHINRLLRNVEQSSQGNVTAAQRTVQGAIVAAYIRQQAGTRASHRRLKRQSVRGFSRDFLHATNTANSALAGTLATLDIAPKMTDLERELDEFIRSGRHAGKGETLPRKNYYDELKVRINAAQNRVEEHYGHRFASAVMEMSFVTHLMSPAYSLINAMQPLVTTWPVLAARFSSGAAGKELGRALVDLNGGRIYWSGLAETAREASGSLRKIAIVPKNYDQMIRGIIGQKEPGFLKVMDRLLDLGYGASAGIEAPEAIEVGRSRAEILIGRMTRVARALPEAVEGANRYVTALATYRLAKRSGMSEDQAVELATTTVEQTQGGYSAENNPAYMSGRWTRLPLQFKKYALMYAQLYWGAMEQALRGADRPTRMRAAKQLAALSATTVVFAGAGGLPMMEVAKGFILIAGALGLTDEDWEEWENALQGYYADALKWATNNGSSSDFFAEMMQRGLSRSVGIDLSNRMGNDSMVLFGEPKSMGEGDVASWILDLAIGAPGGMVSDSLGAISSTLRGEEADWGKILPFPKMMKDISKAYEQGTEGFTTKAGRQVAPPISGPEAVAQSLGFRPASVARQWETKGGGARYAAGKRLMDRRTRVMGQWTNASSADRQRIWRTVIREWNRENPGRRERIDMADLRRSLATRKANARRERRENQ